MVSSRKFFWALVQLSIVGGAYAQDLKPSADPCVAIGGKKWVAPRDVRACYSSIPLDPAIKTNILDVVNKTLAFHTSVNYQVKAPAPFTDDVHEDILADIARIRQQSYKSEYEFHIDISRSVKRLNDGHVAWINRCFDSAFVNYLPIPLALLTDSQGKQDVYIAPEAFKVASAEFPDQIDVWQNATRGKLESFSGAKVLLINGRPPFDAVNDNTKIAGSYQAFGTRQNGFFSSYVLGASSWNYNLGQFAQQALPLSDEVVLLVQKSGSILPELLILPYRSRIGGIQPFTDRASFISNNCRAVAGTNGEDINSGSALKQSPAAKFQQQPEIPAEVARKYPLNVILDASPLTNVLLPPELKPGLPAAGGSRNAAQFYLLKDGKTGVLALGSFSDTDYFPFLNSLLEGLNSLKSQGATQLIVDVTNNGGGFVCAAHWLHRILAGPKSTTVPQAGLDTAARDGPLAQLMSKAIASDPKLDPSILLLYNPLNWADANHHQFAATDDWLQPPVPRTINGRQDAFSQRLGSDCPPEFNFPANIPETALFDPKKVVIVSNGRCASSCSLFSITMSKEEGTKTVVVGGKSDVKQQYCGIVGGQSTDFATIDTDIKSTHLKNHTLAPPDLLVNGVQGITWRLGFGITNREEPEEWQDHPATLNLPLTKDLVNNPVAIWEDVTRRLLA